MTKRNRQNFPRMKDRAYKRRMRKLARARQSDGSLLVKIGCRVWRVGRVYTTKVPEYPAITSQIRETVRQLREAKQ